MKLGISSYTYTWGVGVPGHAPSRPLTVFGLLAKAADLGVGVVQVADNLPLHLLDKHELDNLIRSATAHNIQIEVGTRGIGLDHLRTYLQLAHQLHSPIVRLVIDTKEVQPTEEEAVGRLKSIMPEFEKLDINLAIENHDRFNAGTFRRIIDKVGSDHIGICLDTVNSFGALEGPHEVVRLLGPYTINLHIKDFDVFRASHMMGFSIEGRPAGKGRLNVEWLVTELTVMNRDPNAILELWTPPEADIDATIAKEEQWAAESISFLRKYFRH